MLAAVDRRLARPPTSCGRPPAALAGATRPRSTGPASCWWRSTGRSASRCAVLLSAARLRPPGSAWRAVAELRRGRRRRASSSSWPTCRVARWRGRTSGSTGRSYAGPVDTRGGQPIGLLAVGEPPAARRLGEPSPSGPCARPSCGTDRRGRFAVPGRRRTWPATAAGGRPGVGRVVRLADGVEADRPLTAGRPAGGRGGVWSGRSSRPAGRWPGRARPAPAAAAHGGPVRAAGGRRGAGARPAGRRRVAAEIADACPRPARRPAAAAAVGGGGGRAAAPGGGAGAAPARPAARRGRPRRGRRSRCGWASSGG